MKKIFLFSAIVLFALSLTSCIKDKEYQCQCTYIADINGPSSGQPNKEETTTIKAKFKDDAEIDCSKLESKYMGLFFQGTCLLQ